MTASGEEGQSFAVQAAGNSFMLQQMWQGGGAQQAAWVTCAKRYCHERFQLPLVQMQFTFFT